MATEPVIRIAVSAALLSVYILCLGPLLIYKAYKFHRHSDKIIISKRNPTLTLYHSIVSIMAVMVLGPIYVLYTSDFNSSLTNLCDIIRLWLHPIIAYTFLWGLVVKYWLLAFTIHYFKSTQNAQWKIHINKDQVDNNWFLSHKNTLGSVAYTLKIAAICWLVTMAAYWTVIVTIGDHSLITTFSLLITVLIPLLLIAITWKIIPALYDHLYYLEECRMIIIFGVMYILCHILVGVSPAMGATLYIQQICGNIVGTTGYFVICLLELQFSLSKLKTSHKHDLIHTVIHSADNIAADESVKHQDLTQILRGLLKNGDSLNAFFDHLAKEFSIECGLAYIEFCQFKQLIAEDFFPNEVCIDDEDEICVLSNPEIPLSFIVHGSITDIEYHARHRSKWQRDVPRLAEFGTQSLHLSKKTIQNIVEKKKMDISVYRARAYLLYKKYVDQTSDVQINISFKQRKQIADMLSDKANRSTIDASKLLTIWNPALYEQWKYMTQSCYRFMQTDIYQSLELSPEPPEEDKILDVIHE